MLHCLKNYFLRFRNAYEAKWKQKPQVDYVCYFFMMMMMMMVCLPLALVICADSFQQNRPTARGLLFSLAEYG
jgi:hypothetical protein